MRRGHSWSIEGGVGEGGEHLQQGRLSPEKKVTSFAHLLHHWGRTNWAYRLPGQHRPFMKGRAEWSWGSKSPGSPDSSPSVPARATTPGPQKPRPSIPDTVSRRADAPCVPAPGKPAQALRESELCVRGLCRGSQWRIVSPFREDRRVHLKCQRAKACLRRTCPEKGRAPRGTPQPWVDGSASWARS